MTSHTCPFKLAIAIDHGGFDLVDTDYARFAAAHSVYMAWLAQAFRDQRSTTLLRYTYILLCKGLIIDVGKVNIVELHATNLLKLFLNSAATN